MKTEAIRQAFLDYFNRRGHSIIPSSSLVPAGDPTLLFTNAGMVQFKDVFLGSDKRPYVRATTCQKSLRISGKHNDLENVGRTARHHTFFEMLGNFSFGDYFKEDAIKFAWEFLTETLALPKNRLWVSVYKEDDEAAELWAKHTDVVAGRILRFGKEDNFWAMGETGPCGPCSEIHYYLGDDVQNQSEEEFRKGDGTYIEIWNLVFMQFNRDVSGALTPLPKPSVDTGMGLERIAAVKQGVKANYDTDSLRALIACTEKLSNKRYVGQDYRDRPLHSDLQYATDVAMRVIADHSRASAFLIADGISPGSDGRGYVLRRLIRRACRHGRTLGLRQPFLANVTREVIHTMSGVYPELAASAALIEKVISGEEEKFIATLDSGMEILEREIKGVGDGASKTFSGNVAFVLHDTYGFPLDMTADIVRNHGFSVNHDEFEAAMEAQRERSRSARANETQQILTRVVKPVPCKFLGYEYVEYESRVIGLFGATGEIPLAKAGDDVAVVTEETPFYAESGGQVGDTGGMSSANAALEVIDTQKIAQGTIVHICRVKDGALAAGERVRLAVDDGRRRKLRVNHSATHLLHQALREVLGSHIKQAGSRVSERSLRFDFNHYEAVHSTQLLALEARVNELVRSNYEVATEILPIEEAKKTGAVALFGEKYGDLVRVVQMGPGSREFCGGTHASRSGDIGVFTIFSEGAIAAGVRRIEAYAGGGAFEQIESERQILRDVCGQLRVNPKDAPERIKRIVEEHAAFGKNLDKIKTQASQQKGGDLAKNAKTLKSGIKLIASFVEDASPKELREMADDLRGRMGSACIALASVSEGRAILLTAVTKDLVGQHHAGKILEELGKVVGSKGGGRPDLAQAGGGDPTKIDLALKRFEELMA